MRSEEKIIVSNAKSEYTGLNIVRGVTLAGLLAYGCDTAYGESVVPMEWTDQHNTSLAAGNPERGNTLAAKCDRCHGQNGVSDDDEIPHLAGQNARYIYKQLQDYKSGAREEAGMNKRARRLDDQGMADLATWYSGLQLPEMENIKVPVPPELVTKGDPERSVPACNACHGDDGRGIGEESDVPVLAGMPYDYFVLTLGEFQDGSRINDAGGVVRQFVKSISEEEVKELAEYYLALGKRRRAPLE